MLNVYRSNRLEKLVDALTDVLRTPLGSPYETEWIAVSSQSMRTWLSQELAKRFGVWAGAVFPFPRDMVERLLADGEETTDPSPDFDESRVSFGILRLLPELLAHPEFETLGNYLRDDVNQLKRVQLARRIAHTFDEYALFRPEMVIHWEQGGESHWQARLWRALQETFGFRHIASRAREFIGKQSPVTGIQRVAFFAISQLPPLYVTLLASLPESVEVNLFAISPSREWWGDLSTSARPVITTDLSEHAELERVASGNPMLSSLGRQARDFQWVLESQADYAEPGDDLYIDPQHGGQHLLTDVQSDILNLRTPTAPAGSREADGSIRVHACHSRMREVEVLKDQLFDIFDTSNGGLGPDDVAVLAPNIDDYLPYIEAVFDASGERMPFTIATGAHGSTRHITRAFMGFLDLLQSRLTVQEVFDVLFIEPVRARFGLDEDEVMEARQWVTDAGVRWGIDRDHRVTFGQPELEENTWRFGLDRLLLGLAMPPSDTTLFNGMSPSADLSTQAGESLGKLIQALHTLFDGVRELTAPRPVAEWVVGLQAALGNIVQRTPENEAEYQGIWSGLTDIGAEADAAAFRDPLDLPSVKHLVRERLEGSGCRAAWFPGGVGFSSLLPMRSIPFQVVAVLGMTEGEFPRARRAPAFDLMSAHPRIGDRSPRNDDRHLFLEAVLQARQVLLISYVGQSIRDGSAAPPSVLVRDLIEILESGYGIPRGQTEVSHPLQPFSPRYFVTDGDPRLFSYNRQNLAGARSVLSGSETCEPFFSDALPDVEEERNLDIEELCRFFRSPVEFLMTRRLGVRFPQGEERLPEREPIEAGTPDDWSARRSIVRLLSEGMHTDQVRDILRSQGVLPLGKAGKTRFRMIEGQTENLVREIRRHRVGDPLPPVQVALSLETAAGRSRLFGVIDDMWREARVEYRLSNGLKGGAVLSAWIRHLAMIASPSGVRPERSILLSPRDKTGVDQRIFEGAPDDPSAILSDLVDLYWTGREHLLPLFPDISFAYIEDRHFRSPKKRTVYNFRDGWESSRLSRTIAATTAFRGLDPFAWEPRPGLGFEALSERVFLPIWKAIATSG